MALRWSLAADETRRWVSPARQARLGRPAVSREAIMAPPNRATLRSRTERAAARSSLGKDLSGMEASTCGTIVVATTPAPTRRARPVAIPRPPKAWAAPVMRTKVLVSSGMYAPTDAGSAR